MPYDLGVIKRQRREPPSISTSTYGSSFVGFYSTGSSYYAVHVFTSSGPFTLPSFVTTTTAQLLVVGGGGGGGGPAVSGGVGGGGGAGGVISSSTFSITTTSFGILVGGGGATNFAGQSSTLTNGLTVLTALGGGAGGAPLNGSGSNGSSGGGGSGTGTGGTGISGQGFAGGAGGSQTAYGGAGGGAGAVGDAANSGAAGRGGTGTITRITGVPLYFGGGGGGGANAAGYANGSLTGGGGAGGTTTSPAGASGSLSSGGGGGGGGSTAGAGGAGGSGIVILSYAIPKNLYPDNQSDPYFRNNALLLNATTSTSGNSSLLTYSIFTDFSGNGLSITNNGTTAAILNPFDPGFYHSIYFNGSSYLNIGSNSTYNFIHSATAIITLEFWAYPTSLTTNTFIFSTNAGSAGYIGSSVQITSGRNIAFTVASGSGNFIVQATSAGTISTNVWSHVAVTWNYAGNTGAFYINGNQSGTFVRGQGVGATSNSTLTPTIGQSGLNSNFYNGYVSNLRLVNGTVVYSGIFVIPREPLSTVQYAPSINVATITSGTTALLGRFATTSTLITDYSTLTNVISNTGVSASSLNPFTSTLNESVYFNGSSNRLSSTKASGSWLASNHTVEAWIYLNAAGTMTIASESGGSVTGIIYSWKWNVSTSGISVDYQYLFNGSGGASASITFSLFTWYHVAFTRSGTTVTLFVNGSQVGIGTSGSWDARGILSIGYFGSSFPNWFNGYISNFRIVNDIAVYTGNFTAPTGSLQSTQVANPYGGSNTAAITTGTSLLTLRYGTYGLSPSNFVDYGAYNLGSVSSNFPGQGTFSPFGNNWSTYFNGITDYLVVPDIPAFTVGSNDWTIETWAYLTANTGTAYIAGQFNTNNVAPFGISLSSTNKPTLTLANTTATNSVAITSAIAISTGTWSHLAFVRSGLKFSVYVNGQEQAFTYGGSAYSDSSINSAVAVPSNLTYSSLDPYDQSQYHSLYFNGSSYLNLPANAGYNYSTGDFTWESWVYPITYGSGSGSMIIDFWNGGAGAYATGSCQFWINNSGAVIFSYATSVSLASSIITPTTIPLNAWSHLAVVRLAGNITIYVNGFGNTPTAVATAIGSNTLVGSIGRYTAANGYFFNGYISNVRIVKGLALYAGSLFAVQSSPLSNIQNATLSGASANFTNTTQLLTGRFINPSRYFFDDYSPNNFVLTNNGGVAAANLYPPISSTSTFNSMYFNGSNYLTLANSAALQFGTDDFTVEYWVYFTTTPDTSSQFPVSKWAAGTGWELYYTGNGTRFAFYALAGSPFLGGTTRPVANTWYHLAVSRASGTIRLFVNGTQEASVTGNTTNFNDINILYIGKENNTTNLSFNGYLSNLRIVKGVGVYTSNFTVPSTQLTTTQFSNQNGNNTQAITTGTSLLIGRSSSLITEGSIAVDYSVVPNYITSVGNTFTATNFAPPITSTSTYNSLYFNGSTQYLTVPANAAFTFGTGDLTLECWIYQTVTSTSAYKVIFADNVYGGAGGYTLYSYNNALNLWKGGSPQVEIIAPAGTITLSTWTHISWTRSGSSNRLFINGTQVGATTSDSTNYTGTSLYIGASVLSTLFFPGYISNVRVVKGLAVYTGAFTRPTRPLTTTQAANPYGGSNVQAISTGTYTSLLTLLPYTTNIVDYSTNTSVITIGSGTVSLSTLNPFTTISRSLYFNGNSSLTSNFPVGGLVGSLSFNGTSQYVTVPNSSAITLDTGNFTIEAWVYTTVLNGQNGIFGKRELGQYIGVIFRVLNTTNKLVMQIADASGTAWAIDADTVGDPLLPALTTNTWYHVALVRSGSSFKIYQNGVGGTSYTYAGTITHNTALGYIGKADGASGGQFWNGYITNFRIVKGTAVYTTNFTPTAPLNNITNTTLLLLVASDANKIVDSSSTPLTVTNNGATYSSLILPSYNPGWLNQGDHTVEAWVNLNTLSPVSMLIAGTYDGVSTIGWEWTINNYQMSINYRVNGTLTGSLSVGYSQTTLSSLLVDFSPYVQTVTNNGGVLLTGSNPFTTDASFGSLSFIGTNYLTVPQSANFTFSGDFTIEFWVYIISGSGVGGYGDLVGTANNGSFLGSGNSGWVVGYYPTGNSIHFGYQNSSSWTYDAALGLSVSLSTWNHIAVVRNGTTITGYLNGVAGTTPITGAGATLTSNLYGPIIGGGAGGGSGKLNGYMSNIRIVNGIAVYTGNFTKPVGNLSSTQSANPFGGAFTAAIPSSSYTSLLIGLTTSSSISFTPNTWYHVAFSRLGTTASMYVNGVRTSSTIITSYTEQNTLRLGYMGFSTATSTYLTGYISNFRIVSGVAVYTGTNFVPPTGVLTTQQPTNPWSGTNTNAITFNTSTRFLTAIPSSQIITPYNSTASMLIGTAGSAITSMYPGYLSNFRMVNGTALYTGNFTPSTSPLARIDNTSLLIAANNNHVDDSVYNQYITTGTLNSSPTITKFTPYKIPGEYNKSMVGGSVYFSTSTAGSQNLNLGTAATSALGSGDFTVECWIYPTLYNSLGGIILDWRTNGGTTANVPVLYLAANGTLRFQATGGTDLITSTRSVFLNTWNHISLVRNGSTIAMYINGYMVGIASPNTTAFIIQTLFLGGAVTANLTTFYGYISSVRILVGRSIYNNLTTTVPTTALTTTSNTQLITLQNNLINNSTNSNFVRLVTANITTATVVAPYTPFGGSGSAYFNSQYNYLTVPSNTGFAFSGGDFSLEAWLYPTARNAVYGSVIIGPIRYSVTTDWVWMLNTSGLLYFQIGAGTGVSSTNPVKLNQWSHVACVRYNALTTFYINGQINGSGTPAGGTLTPVIVSAAGALSITSGNDVSAVNSAFAVGLGDFTAECWVYLSSTGSDVTYASFLTSVSSTVAGILIGRDVAGLIPPNGSGTYVTLGWLSAFVTDVWVHVALTNQSSTVRLFRNGILQATGTNPGTGSMNNTVLALGRRYTDTPAYQFVGYITGVRFVAGTALYTSSFNPLTSSNILDATSNVSGTKLLLLVNSNANKIVDTTGLSTMSNTGATYYNASLPSFTNYIISGTGNTINNTINVGIGSDITGNAATTFNGYITNLHVVKGTAKYITSFTPLTSDITTVSNTVLLTLLSTDTTFIDRSINSFAITNSTTATSLQAFSPFNTNYSTYFDGSSFVGAANFDGFNFSTSTEWTVEAWVNPNGNYASNNILFAKRNAGIFNALSFNGTTQYLAVVNSTAFLFGTGDFTIECWVNYIAGGTNNGVWHLASTTLPSTFSGLALAYSSSAWRIYYGSAGTYSAVATSTMSTNNWNHVALVRNLGVLTLYVNGVGYVVATNDTTNYYYTTNLAIGGYYSTTYLMNGYIANFRIVNGTAVYSGNFTVPNEPLTTTQPSNAFGGFNTNAITSGTVLIIGQFNDGLSNTIVDISYTTGTSITNSGTVAGTTLGPTFNNSVRFNGSSQYLITSPIPSLNFGQGDFTVEAWVYPTANQSTDSLIVSASGIGGSLYFNGSNYLSTPVDTVNFQLATSTTPWTLEAWVYPTAFNGVSIISSVYSGSGAIPFVLAMQPAASGVFDSAVIGAYPAINYYNGSAWGVNGNTGLVSSVPLVLNTWQHVAGVYSGSTASIYINGVRTATQSGITWVASASSAQLVIGRRWAITSAANYFTGYMTNIRFVNGRALYRDAAFILPTAPLTLTTFTSITTNLSTIDTALLLNVSSSATYITDSSTSSFTITNTAIVSYSNNSPYSSGINGVGFFMGYSSTATSWGWGGSGNGWDYAVGAGRLNNVWQHLAVSRSGTDMRMFVNGIQAGLTQVNSSTYDLSIGSTYIGGQKTGYNFAGYISNVRAMNGVALYTQDFTPPIGPFSKYRQILSSPSSGSIKFSNTSSYAFTATGSLYFNSSTYISAVDSSLVIGTNDFTIEFWVYFTDNGFGAGGGFFHLASELLPSTPFQTGLALGRQGQSIVVYWGPIVVDRGSVSNITYTTNLNTWYHMALVRSSGVLILYINGVGYTVSSSDTTNYNYTTALSIGGYFSINYLLVGYITNFRLINGSAFYTSNFLPTLPLVNITNTKLLLSVASNANKTIDSSSSPLTVLNTGTSKWISSAPAGFTAPTGSLSSSSVWVNSISPFGTSDFTIECWIYSTTANIGNSSWVWSNNSADLLFSWYAGNVYIFIDGAININISPSGLVLSTWHHIALVRIGGVFKCYLNGTQGGSSFTTSTYYASSTISVGNFFVNQGSGDEAGTPGTIANFAGYITNFRVVGLGVYTGNFTRPANKLTATQSAGTNISAISGSTTKLLLSFNTAATILTDSSPNPLLVYTSNMARYSNGLVPTTGYSSNSNTNYVSMSTSSALALGSNDFTIEFWMNSTSTNNSAIIGNGTGTGTVYTASTNSWSIVTNPSITIPDTGSTTATGSLYFDGTTSISAPASTSWSFGSGNFTIEAWVYWAGTMPTDTGQYCIVSNLLTGENRTWDLQYSNNHWRLSTYGTVTVPPGISSWEITGNSIASLGTILGNTWYHIAATRSGTTGQIWVNGNDVTTASDIGSANLSTSNVLFVGKSARSSLSTPAYWTGYITNVRIVKGTALYTSAFTPSVPLSQVGAVLLQVTNDATKFVDAQGGATFTNNGNVTFSTNVPSVTRFIGQAAGSLSFTGASQYITVGAAANWTFLHNGLQDYTIEAWINLNSITGTSPTIMNTADRSAGVIGIWFMISNVSAGDIDFVILGGASVAGWRTAGGLVSANKWYHIAFTFVSTTKTGTIYLNGTSVFSSVQSGIYTATVGTNVLSIGRHQVGASGNSSFNGYMTNVRITKSVLYSGSPISIPVLPLSSNAYTYLLMLAFSGNYYADSSGNFTPTNVGAVYRTKSPLSVSLSQTTYNKTGAIGLQSSNAGALLQSAASNLSNGSWNHVALVRSSSTFSLYVNGIISSIANSTATIDSGITETLNIGTSGFSDDYGYQGYLSNVRLVRGQAIYTGNFTVPTQILQNTQNSGTNILAITTARNVALLTAQYNSLITDYSTNALPINVNTAELGITVNPTLFYPAYSAAFNITTSSQYLQISTSSFSFTTGTNFTVEAWVYLVDYSTTASVLFGTAAPLSPNYVPVASSAYSTSTGGTTPNWGWNNNGTNYSLMSAGGTGTWQFGSFAIGVQSASGGARTTALLEDKNYYLEIAITAAAGNKGFTIGLARASVSGTANYTGIYLFDGNIYINDNLQPGALGAYVIGDVINVAYNPTTNKQWIGKNGVWHTLGGYPGLPASTGISGGSLYFNGTNQYLTTAYSTALFDWYTSGVDYTIECWIYPTTYTNWYSATSNSPPTTVGNMAFNAATNYWSFGIGSATGQIRFYYYEGTAGGQSVVSTNTVPLNYWSHIAMTKTSGGITLFVNGVAQTTTAIIGTPQSSASFALTMGAYNAYYQNGYVTNLRIVKGVAVYVGNFTIPTSALNTTQSGALTNTSGSLSFAGGANSIILPVDSQLAVGTSDFTIEFWIYPTANMANFTKFITSGVGGGLSIETQRDGNRIHVTNYSTTDYLGSTNALTLNAWTHVAVVRISGILTIYLNGAFNGSVSNSVNFTQIRYIGGWPAYFTGYLTNIRLIVGTGYYTGPFTGSVPTSPLTTVTNTKLLLLASDSGSILTDSSGVITGITNSSSPATYSVLNPFGVPSGIKAISTASYTSLLLKVASSGTYITDSSTTPNTIANLNTLVYSSLAPPGQGGGFNIAGTGALSFIFASGTSALGGPNTSGQFRKPLQFTYGTPTGFYGYNATGWYLNLGRDINSLSVNSDAAGTWTTNLTVGAGEGVPLITWTHIAMVRNGNELSLFKNGSLVTFTAGANDWNFSNPNNIGYIGYYNYYNNGTTSTYLKGYVSNLRIVSGQALYQSSFTPLTAPFENLQISSIGTDAITTASNVQLLTAQSNIIVDNSTNNLSIANTATTPVSVTANATYMYTGYVYETSSTVLLTANFIGTETTVVDHSYNTASITLVNSPTISALSPFVTIIPSNTSTSYQGYLNAGNGYLGFSTYDGFTRNVQLSTTALTTGTWNHVAYTYNTLRDYHQLSMYVNGNRIFTTSSFTTLTTTQVVGSPVTQLVLTNNPTTITSSTYIFGATNASDFEFSIGFPGIGRATGYLGMGYINLSTMAYTKAAEWAWYATYNLPIARSLINYAINPAIASNNFRLHAIKIGNNLTISIDDVNNIAQESETIALIAGTNYKIYVYYIKDTYNDTRTGIIITDTVSAFSAITTSSVNNLVSAVISDSNENFFVGGILNTSENFSGYMSNLRVVKDSALYLGISVGIPTANLGTLTNTVTFPETPAIKTALLILQDEYVKDNSSYSNTLVTSGTPKTTVFSPFSTNNLSAYFNGTSVMIFPNTPSLNIAGSPWTIELWLNHPGNYTNYNSLFAKRNTSVSTDTSYEGYLAITTGYIGFYNGTQYLSTTIAPPNVWNHIAYVYDGTAINIYLNGLCVYSAVVTVVDIVSPLVIGAVQYTTAPTYNEYLYGYMSNFRIIKGTALYNSTFNPSQIPLALYSGNTTNLLLNFTDSKAVDYSGNTTIRTNNTTTYTISNLTTKYNQYSLSFNGSSDVLIATSSTSFVYGSNDFTWEMWIYPTSSTWNTSLTYLLDHGGAGAGGSLRYNSDRLSYFNATGATSTASASLSISTSTWTHIAVARQNAVTSVFINGMFVVSTQTDTYNYTFPSVAVGNLNTTTTTPNYFQGYMEDVRLTKGVARYTSQVFVPPIKLSNR